MPQDKAVRQPKEKPVVTDSEGLRVSTTHTEPADDEGESVSKVAREAYEAEVAADEREAKAAADEEAQNKENYQKFLAEQAK